MDIKKESGYHGHQEFNSVRKKIIQDYQDAKDKYKNRPTPTEHGKVSENLLSNWLKESLPQKYGVTSGYIIPDLYVENYTVYHFDIIIYDRLESPVLWAEPAEGSSKARAIPAKYVFAIYEVKASLNPNSVVEAMRKLDSVSQYSNLFPSNFHSKAIFMELPLKHIEKKSAILNKFIVEKPVHGFTGAYVFSTGVNANISATIHADGNIKDPEIKKREYNKKLLVKDVDDIVFEVHNDNEFKFHNPEPGYIIDTMSMGGKIVGMVKSYEQHLISNNTRIFILWSRNEFAVFFHELLSRLDKGSFNRYEMKFGLSFD